MKETSNVVGGPKDGSYMSEPDDGETQGNFNYDPKRRLWCRYTFHPEQKRWIFVESFGSILK